MSEHYAATIAAPPTTAGVMILLDDGQRRHGPALGWAPRPDNRHPQRGDRCTAVEDTDGQWWIVAWQAGGADPTPSPEGPPGPPGEDGPPGEPGADGAPGPTLPVNELPAPTGTLNMDGERIEGLPPTNPLLPPPPYDFLHGPMQPVWSTFPDTAAASIGFLRYWTRNSVIWTQTAQPTVGGRIVTTGAVPRELHGTHVVSVTGARITGLTAAPTAADHAANKAYVDAAIASAIVGEIKMGVWSTVPTGFLECNGQAVSRSTYSALFAEIGTAHGAGDGSSTFNVPDMRGRSPMGAGTGTGLTARSNGQKVGSETHTLDISEIPAHRHGIVGAAWSSNLPPGARQNVTLAPNTAANWGLTDLPAGDPNETPIYYAGGGQAHNNVQPATIVRFVIRT